MSEDGDNEMPAVAFFFSKRAKFVPKVTAEDFQATSELLSRKRQEEKDKSTSNDVKAEVPPVKKSKGKKVSAKKKPVEIINENSVEADSTPAVPLSAAAKRRLKKLQEQRNTELRIIEEANERVLSVLNTTTSNELEEEVEDDFDKVNVLTISYLSEVSRLKCYEHEKFSTILPKVADLFKLKASEFLLCHREQNIQVDDTPKSLNIVHSDILECIPYKPDENAETEYDVDKLKVLFQTSDNKRKTEMLVHKLEKMQDVMKRYSKTQNLPLNKLVFEFDGERISGTETPEDMDMESGSCIDVRVLTPKKAARQKASKKSKNEVQCIVISDSESGNGCDVVLEDDSDSCDVIVCD